MVEYSLGQKKKTVVYPIKAVPTVLGPELIFPKRDKHYPSRSRQTSLATAVSNISKPVAKINFGPSSLKLPFHE